MLLILLLVSLSIHITVKTLKTLHLKKKLPPGPWKLPIIGNLHQILNSEAHLSLRNLAKKHGPVMLLQLGEIPTVVISSKEIAENVLKEVNFAQRPKIDALKDLNKFELRAISFFAPYDESWREMRRIHLTELLSKQRVKSFKNARENAVWNFVESIFSTSGKPINFTEKLSDFIYTLNYRILFGKTNEYDHHLISLLKQHVIVGQRLFFANSFPTFQYFMNVRKLKSKHFVIQKKCLTILDALVQDSKAERRAKKTTSPSFGDGTLVDALLQVQESGSEKVSFTDDVIKDTITEIFAGASETTSTTVEWAMSELVKNPRVMAKAQAEVRQHLKGKKEIDQTDIEQLEYLKLVIKETLRFHPPIPLLPRISKEKCEIIGYEIPEETQIIVNVWALCRDPNYWENPDEFRPERFKDSSISFRGINFELIPFGAGRRICPGITFATAIIELLLAQLLYHFDWKLASREEAERHGWTKVPGPLDQRKKVLYLVASPAY